MKTINLLGIDLAKEVFEIQGVDVNDKRIFRRTIRREDLAVFTAQLPSCLIAMEACAGAHHWARVFSQQGHSIKMMAAHHVKPFRASRQKNDRRDTESIIDAARREKIRSVPPKSLEQQDLQSCHRTREQLVGMRTKIVNHIRGLLMEYGVIIPEGIRKFEAQLPVILESADNQLTSSIRFIAAASFDHYRFIVGKIKEIEKLIESLVCRREDYNRILNVPGIGPLTASLFLASVNVQNFKNGRHVSAWLGTVPRQNSSGGKAKLGRITKSGDRHLRVMMVHGARSLIRATVQKQGHDSKSQWILRLLKEKGWNRTAIAVANKNTRIMWHLLRYEEDYKKVA